MSETRYTQAELDAAIARAAADHSACLDVVNRYRDKLEAVEAAMGRTEKRLAMLEAFCRALAADRIENAHLLVGGEYSPALAAAKLFLRDIP